MATTRFCLTIAGTSFLLSAKDGGAVMDILTNAHHVDTVYGFEGRTHRDMGAERHNIALTTTQGALVSVEEYREYRNVQDAKWEAERAERKAAAEAAAADKG